MKTNRTLWSWLMDVFAPAPAPTPRAAQELKTRSYIRVETPQAFDIQELRWA